MVNHCIRAGGHSPEGWFDSNHARHIIMQMWRSGLTRLAATQLSRRFKSCLLLYMRFWSNGYDF